VLSRKVGATRFGVKCTRGSRTPDDLDGARGMLHATVLSCPSGAHRDSLASDLERKPFPSTVLASGVERAWAHEYPDAMTTTLVGLADLAIDRVAVQEVPA